MGEHDSIYMGWYKNNMKHGNWMSINAHTMHIRISGWYEENIRIGNMKDHDELKRFSRADIFVDEYLYKIQ